MASLSPDRMTRAERLDEVARLLALAILRRRDRARAASDAALAAPPARATAPEKSSRSGLDSRRQMRLTVPRKEPRHERKHSGAGQPNSTE